MRKLLALACAGLFLAESTGCSITTGMCRALDQSECVDDFMIGYKNRALAEKAWHCRRERFHERMHGKEFKDGFIDGYLAVAEGGDGCIPTVAPSKYWGWRYQSSNGQSAINSYFQGYPMGVKAAEQDGVGHWQQIRTFNSPRPVPMMPADGSDVENPFYPEDEIIPAPIPESFPPQWEGELSDPEIIEAPQPDAAINAVSPSFSMEASQEVPELIARRPDDSSSTPVAATLDDAAVQLNAPAAAPVDEGSATVDESPAQNALPFTFE